MLRILSIALSLTTLAACSFPYDAEGTLNRVRESGVLRVGVSERPPWVIVSATHVEGIEARLASGWADQLGATTEWMRGSESDLVAALEERRIDLLIGGFAVDSPWVSEAAATQPYLGDRVMLVSPGESAFLLSLDKFLSAARRSGELRAGADA